MSIAVPPEYIAYVEEGGSAEAFTDGLPGYFELLHPHEIEEKNSELDVARHVPGFIGFGTDGGGQLLAFDATGAVFMLPLVGMEPQSRHAGSGLHSN